MLESTLDEIVGRVVEVADPERVILFGSRARGEERFDSDYDLLVIKSSVKHRRALAQQIYRNLAGVGVSVDVLVEPLSTLKVVNALQGCCMPKP